MSYRGRSPITGLSSVQAGTQLSGIYHIDRLIAAGGMSEVYLGHNIQTGDPVAIKIVLPEFAEDEMILELLKKEARILFQLAHEAIVRYYVFTIDPAFGRPYLAMEYVDGPSLAQRMQSGPLSLEDTVVLKTRIADGMNTAHAAGVIHRDLSPDNIILPDNSVGRTKIIDFSIARTTKIGSGTILAGSFAGKYNFVSPEQLGMFGGDVTPKSDIYSLGLVLTAALRGEPLDMAGSQADVVEKRRQVPDLAGVDPRMHELLRAMLTPDPNKRLDSMAKVRDWGVEAPRQEPRPLRAAAEPRTRTTEREDPVRPIARPPAPRAAQPSAPSSRAALWSTLAVVAMIAAGALGGWYYVTHMSPRDPAVVTAEIQSFLHDYQGGACFFADPLSVPGKAAEVAIYSQSEAEARKFQEAFNRAKGFEPKTLFLPVLPTQCAVVEAVQSLSQGTRSRPEIILDKQTLQLEDDPAGTVRSVVGGSLYLLIVDNAGVISNVTRTLKGANGQYRFSVPVTITEKDPVKLAQLLNQPQLIVTVSSESPILDLDQLKVSKSEKLKPVLTSQKDISVALGYFKFSDQN